MIRGRPMIRAAILPAEGFVGIDVVIGRPPVTEEEAERNRALALEAAHAGRQFTRPRRARDGVQGVLPWGRTFLYDQISAGRFPSPLKVGRRAMWHVDDVRRALAELAKRPSEEGSN